MKTALPGLAAIAALTLTSRAALTSFTYTQTDSLTGGGTIAAFSYDDGGGPINFGATAMTAATVVNPVPGSTPAGYVGAMNAQAGASNEPNTAVGLTWTGFIVATGTRGANTYTINIPYVFVAKQTQAPDTNDYNWSVAWGDNPAAGIDAVTGSNRFAMWFSRDTVIDTVETVDTFQRYTQLNHTFVLGVQETFTNTDTSTAPIKDATDAGAPLGNDAAGRNLAFYYGWRDQGSLTQGAFLVDTFTVGGLLNADEASLTLIPEPSSGLLALGAAGLLLRRRRR